MSPGCEVCQWPHYARTFGLGSAPGYPPAGNCVPLSCLVLGLFWLFDFFFAVVVVFFFFLVSDLQLVQIMLAADDCRKKKISKHKRKKKEGPPQTKGLKKQTKKPNPHGEEWRGSYCLGGPWNLLQSMNRSPKRAPLAGWESSVLCVSYFCVHFRVQVCLDFDFF